MIEKALVERKNVKIRTENSTLGHIERLMIQTSSFFIVIFSYIRQTIGYFISKCKLEVRCNRYYTKIIIFLLVSSCSKINTDYPFKYHNAEDFLNKSSENINNIPKQIIINTPDNKIIPKSGTVSHHLLVSPIINQWFKELKKQNNDIENFFIISPKHYDLGEGIICLSSLDWKINDDISVKTNKKYVKKILKTLSLTEVRYAFHKEHGIYALVPFINYYYSGAKVIPIVMDEYKKQVGKCRELSAVISKIMLKDNKSFLIVSTDFSHKSNLAEAQRRDAISKDILNSLNPEWISKIYSDNNAGLYTLFFTCKELGIKNNYVLCHTNAESYLSKKLEDVTSYFFTYQYSR